MGVSPPAPAGRPVPTDRPVPTGSPPLRGRSTWSTDHRLLRESLASERGPVIVTGDSCGW